jgi:hypothetical protein
MPLILDSYNVQDTGGNTILKDQLVRYLADKSLNKHQHAFITDQHHSTATNQLEFINDSLVSIRSPNRIDVVYIDLLRSSILF